MHNEKVRMLAHAGVLLGGGKRIRRAYRGSAMSRARVHTWSRAIIQLYSHAPELVQLVSSFTQYIHSI